jgi:hypothetical protein
MDGPLGAADDTTKPVADLTERLWQLTRNGCFLSGI